MDLNSLKDLNNSNYCKSSQINVISSTSGTEVTKLNESTSTKVQEQNKTEKFEILEISKLQVPVKPIIATSSVINSPIINEKNVDSHYTSSSLDNSSSTSGIEVTKLIGSTSTKEQEQNKTEKFEILEISNLQVPVKPIIATSSVISSPKINEKNVDPHYTSSSLNNSSSSSGIEITKLIESTSTKVQEQNKTEKFEILEISKQQMPVKPNIATTSVISSPKINEKNIDVTKLNEFTITKVKDLNKIF